MRFRECLRTIMSKRGFALLGALSVVLFIACNPGKGRAPMGTVVQRLPSPSGKIDAVLTRLQPHKTGTNVYKVVMVYHGQSLAKGNVCFKAKEVKGLKLYWLTNQKLLLRYDKAWITYLWSASKPPPGSIPDIYSMTIELAPSAFVPQSTVDEVLHRSVNKTTARQPK